jgi:hypothetical protein
VALVQVEPEVALVHGELEVAPDRGTSGLVDTSDPVALD